MYEIYYEVVRVLRDKCAPAFPVRVRRVKMTADDGDCVLAPTVLIDRSGNKTTKIFDIRINRDLPEQSAIDVLLHEWAHARAWNHLHDALEDQEFEERVHDATWGVAYSEVYRIYEKYFLSD